MSRNFFLNLSETLYLFWLSSVLLKMSSSTKVDEVEKHVFPIQLRLETLKD